LQKVFPDRKFYTLCSMCFDMKKNTLEKIRDCLVNEKPVVSVDPAVSGKALQAFERMFNI